MLMTERAFVLDAKTKSTLLHCLYRRTRVTVEVCYCNQPNKFVLASLGNTCCPSASGTWISHSPRVTVWIQTQWVVIETLFFTELSAHLLWHNKRWFLPASFLTLCCHGWFMLSGQCWCEDWLAAGDLRQECWSRMDCSWYKRWSCFPVICQPQNTFFFFLHTYVRPL